MKLENKNVLVFAATGAIGSAAARQLSSAGATVWLSARDQGRLNALAQAIHNDGGRAKVDVVDATDETEVARYVDRIAEDGPIDAAFNAIGVHVSKGGWARPSSTVTEDLFRPSFEVIVWSQFLTARTAATHMSVTAGSAILLSASVSAYPTPCMATIAAASGAVEALTRNLAAEYRSSGIRVNCVRAGGMSETRMIQETGAHYTAHVPTAANRTAQPPKPPPARQLTVADTARVVAFLASDDSSGINGQTLTVDAGHALG